MKYVCHSCRKDFAELPITLEMIENLASRLTPGGMIPDGECPFCSGFVYASDRFAEALEIDCARTMYQTNEIEIDDDARASHAVGHLWVQAWVLVPKHGQDLLAH